MRTSSAAHSSSSCALLNKTRACNSIGYRDVYSVADVVTFFVIIHLCMLRFEFYFIHFYLFDLINFLHNVNVSVFDLMIK